MVDRSGQALVMDFGMAYHHGEQRLTDEGAVLGTLAYLSPEQARGLPTDPRSDIYALGLCSTRCSPAAARPATAVSLPLALRDAGERCPPPSRFAPEVPARSTRSSCAASSATPRAASPPRSRSSRRSATRPPPPLRAWRAPLPARWLRKAWPLVAAEPAAAAASVAAWWWWREAGGGPTPSPVVVLLPPLANVGSDPGDEYLGVGIADSLITHLAGLPSVTVVSRSATLESGRRLSGTRALPRDLGVTYVVNGVWQRADNRIRVTLFPVRPVHLLPWGARSKAPSTASSRCSAASPRTSAKAAPTLTRAAREPLARPPAASMDAYADYSKARAPPGAARRAR